MRGVDREELIHQVILATSIQGRADSFVFDEGAEETFKGRGNAEITLNSAHTKAIMLNLAAHWPGGMMFSEIYEIAKVFLMDNQHAFPKHEEGAIISELFQLFEAGQLDFRLRNFRADDINGTEFPRACALARWEATQRDSVTTPYHIPLLLSDEERELLSRMDGKHTKTSLRNLFGVELTDRTYWVMGQSGLLESSEEQRVNISIS